MKAQPTDLPGYGRFDRSIPVYPVLESRPLVVWTDRAGDTWVPTTRTTYDGERLLECQSPQEPADQGEGDSFAWTYRSVAAWFGPLQERRMGGGASTRPAPEPNSCRWCGIAQRQHAQRWKQPVGWHKWEQPTQAQIKDRMLARRMGGAA